MRRTTRPMNLIAALVLWVGSLWGASLCMAQDSDGDGLTDAEELAGFKVTIYIRSGIDIAEPLDRTFRTAIDNPDTDGDGISDWDEVMTYARAAEADGSVPSITTADGQPLRAFAGRAGQLVFGPGMTLEDLPANDFRRTSDRVFRPKSVWGVRTAGANISTDIPDARDTDGDGLLDPDDPAPQLNPVTFQFAANIDQSLLLNFDQDNDGFLAGPFVKYTEAVLEFQLNVDYSNDGTFLDGFDVGGPPLDAADRRAFVVYTTAGRFLGGNGVIDNIVATTDRCPEVSNPDPNNPPCAAPTTTTTGLCGGGTSTCGFGALSFVPFTLVGLGGIKVWNRGRRRA